MWYIIVVERDLVDDEIFMLLIGLYDSGVLLVSGYLLINGMMSKFVFILLIILWYVGIKWLINEWWWL